MGRICRILWPYVWCGLLLCLLSIASKSEAATRKHVSVPSKQATVQNPSAVASRSGDTLSVLGGAVEGEYIPASGRGTPGTPMKVLPRVDGSIPRTLQHVKSGLRGGLIGVAGSVVLGALLDQVDAFIDENTKEPMKKGRGLTPSPDLYWCHELGTNFCDDSTLYRRRLSTPTEYPILYKLQFGHVNDICSTTYTSQNGGVQVLVKYTFNSVGTCGDRDAGSQITYYRRGSCPEPFRYDPEFMQCAADDVPVALDDADYNAMFDFANRQNAEWLKNLLNDACMGSLSPGRCFDDLLSQGPLSGPASVNGPTTTKTTTSTSPTGITTQTVTTTGTTYNIKYGDKYYDYSTTTKTTVVNNGATESVSVESDSDEVDQEQPEESSQEQPVLCSGSGCEGPAYQDMYEPTEHTKEDSIDDYLNRVQQIPILRAMGGLFDISVSGSCPVWQVNHTLEILGASFHINLVFDFLCVSWFLSLGPWIRAVVYAVAAAAAIRVAVL